MDALEAILTRRSTRNYRPDAVEEEKLGQILDAARQAPSGGNSQTNHFLVIRNPQVLRKLALMAEEALAGMAITEDTYRRLKNSIALSKRGEYMVRLSSVILQVTAGFRTAAGCRRRGTKLLLSTETNSKAVKSWQMKAESGS